MRKSIWLIAVALLTALLFLPLGSSATSHTACDQLHNSFKGWHPPVMNGCHFGHEHGDHPDPHGHFRRAGVPEMAFAPLVELVHHHDGHHEHHAGFKVIYHNGGTPSDPRDDFRSVYHQLSTNRNNARFYEVFVRDRDPRFLGHKFHSAQLQMLGPNRTHLDVKWVDAVGDMHPRKSAKMMSAAEMRRIWELYERDPKRAICEIKAEDTCGGTAPKESWYWVDYANDRKEGVPLPLWRFSFTDRILNPPSFIDPKATGNARLTPRWTCEANGFAITDPACPADGTMRFVDKAEVKILAKRAGTYWTDIYGKRVYGTGATAPANCDGPCVRQHVGFVSSTVRVFEDRLRWYDAPGVVVPN